MTSLDSGISSCNSEEDIVVKPANLDNTSNEIYEGLLEEIITGIAFEEHQLHRFGGVPSMTEEDVKPYAIAVNNETDIFGQPHAKTVPYCCCPICNRPVSATVFARHLSKCLGMGRSSSRRASRRITNICKENAYGGTSDDDDDFWVAGQEKSKLNKKVEGKTKKDKNGVRKVKSVKVVNEKNNTGKISDDHIQNTKYESTDTKG